MPKRPLATPPTLPTLCVSGLNFDFDIRVRFLALAKFCGRVVRLSF